MSAGSQAGLQLTYQITHLRPAWHLAVLLVKVEPLGDSQAVKVCSNSPELRTLVDQVFVPTGRNQELAVAVQRHRLRWPCAVR